MLICGIKVTHDGGVALLEDNRLIFSIEAEKLVNAERYSSLGDLDNVAQILLAEGVDPAAVDEYVVDGWYPEGGTEEARALDPSVIPVTYRGKSSKLTVAPYQDRPGSSDPLAHFIFDDFSFGKPGQEYSSFHHVSGHIMGAYCSSPFAARGEDAVVLVWDGGTVPRLYLVQARMRLVTAVTNLMPITGNAFGQFSGIFGPFSRSVDGLTEDEATRYRLSIAGKAMAYAALGSIQESAFQVFDRLFATVPDASPKAAEILGSHLLANRNGLVPGMTDADLIATFQAYLGRMLLDRLASLINLGRIAALSNLVLSGGCALNIKWNSALRASGLFADIWVAPFPNDSGAGIGAASCAMFRQSHHLALDWNVYSGPKVAVGDVPCGWLQRPCDERELASILHRDGDPVVVLSGRAEVGPRALGNRSILAPATSSKMKDCLNAIKGRAAYRPVAPICLASRASDVFAPGGHDPYMLFEHRPRGEWSERIPAVLHLDGTARLQTVDDSSDTAISRILTAYNAVSGVPVLCNTSANLNGRGFFPDVASAAEWGGTKYIWSDGTLWTKRVTDLP